MTVKKGAYMYIKWMVPDYGMRGILNGIGRFLFGENDEVHYIGGAEVLPPPLDAGEESVCIRMLATDAAEEARRKLIEHNLRLVVYIAKKFDNTGVGVEDLISIGTIGLIKAINTFNPDKNIKLATYASRCIENEILMHFRSRKKSRGDVSIFEPIGTDKEGNQIHLVDVIENGQSDVVSDIEVSESLKILRQNMRSVLSDREYYIITKRFGLDGEKELTQRQIAKTLSISRSYVSRIERAGLKKLRKLLE